MLNVKPLPLSRFLKAIQNVDGFAYARFSDGGFFSIRDPSGVNCDGVVYTEAQRQALLSVLRDETVTHAITSIALHIAHPEKILQDHGIEVEWYDADTLNVESERGTLYPFIHVLRRKRVLMVGPNHLRRLKAFPTVEFVEVHPKRAFEELDRTLPLVFELIENFGVDVVLISAGQAAAPTLVSRIHRENSHVVLLDCGSIWDPYVGVMSRSGHKRRGWKGAKELGRLNFGMDISRWRQEVVGP